MSQDFLLFGTAAEDTVRCMAVITTNLVNEAMRRHQTAPTATAALGRALTGALLLGASVKELDRLTVQINGDGPLGQITAEANAQGQARGYVHNPETDLPLNEFGKFDVQGAVGHGMFNVMRESGYEMGLHREPYRSSVPLVSGEIAEDFAYYLALSEQTPSAVLLGVQIGSPGDSQEIRVTAAGGLMIQMMPGAEDNIIAELERAIQKLPQTTELIRAGATPDDLITAVLSPRPFNKLGEMEVNFACTCSFNRAESIIAALPRTEVESMLAEDGGARFICHFCNENYFLGPAVFGKILNATT